jgi:methyl-accepting chemotaxis protein
MQNFGFNTSSKMPIEEFIGESDSKSGSDDVNSTEDAMMNYIYGLIGTVVPGAIISLIVFLYFAFGCCCCCCCNKREHKKINIIWLIVHICFCCLILVSCIFFFLTLSSLTYGLGEASDVLPSIADAIGTILDVFNTTIDGALDLVDDTLDDAIDLFNDVINETNNNLDTAVQAADDTVAAMNDLKSRVNTVKSSADTFDTDFADLVTYCGFEAINLGATVNGMTDRMDDIDNNIGQLSDAKDQMKGFSSDIQDQLNSVQTEVNDAVDSFKNGDITSILEPIESTQDTINSTSDSFGTILKPVNTYVKLVSWIVTALALVTCVCLIAFYFCTNCCARCCFSCFFPISAIWSFFAFLLCVVFSAFFFLLSDVCGEIENAADAALGDMLGEGTNLSALLVCPEKKPIYELANLDEVIDYKSIIEDLKKDIKDQIDTVDPGSILDKLSDVLKVNISKQFDEDDMKGFNTQQMKDSLDNLKPIAESKGGQCLTSYNAKINQLKTDLDNVDSSFKSAISVGLTAAQDNAIKARDAAEKFKPLISNATNKTASLVTDLTDSIGKVVDNGVTSLDCTIICNVYAPAKNTLCVHLVDGFGYGLVAFIILVCGLFCISITICNRRGHMYPQKVEDVPDEAPDQKMDNKEIYEEHYVTAQETHNYPANEQVTITAVYQETQPQMYAPNMVPPPPVYDPNMAPQPMYAPPVADQNAQAIINSYPLSQPNEIPTTMPNDNSEPDDIPIGHDEDV